MRRGVFILIALLAAWLCGCASAPRFLPQINVTTASDNLTLASENSNTNTWTYDADNRLRTVDGNPVSVDNDGNLTSGPLTNDTLAPYAYDPRNRLLNAGGVTNTFDALNNRIGENYGTNAVTYVVNPNARLSQVLLRIKNGVTNYYIYGAGLLYQVTESATGTNTRAYHYDYRGSTIALSGNNGQVTDWVEYSLYGTTTYHLGTNDTPFLFHGRYGVMTDPNSLLCMRARYYNPYLCRFINPDRSGFGGGLNFYAYANGNPVGYADPTGLGALSENNLNGSLASEPIAEEVAQQQILADFVNFLTLGTANLASEAIQGTDIYGNAVPPEEQNAAAINLVVMLVPGLGVEGAADGLAVEAAEDLSSTASTMMSGAAEGAGPEATGFLGSKNFELVNAVQAGDDVVVQGVRNTPTTINDIDYSGHALDQMQNRGIMPSVVDNTINVGTQFPTRAGTVGYFDPVNNVRVIVNSQNGTVVTVIKGAP